MELSDAEKRAFLEVVWSRYDKHGRHDLAWRRSEPDGRYDPYKIFVSELMLQQTQVQRVTPKFDAFIRQFPTYEALADSELADVLRQWQGLGYNRRAKFLWQAAQQLKVLGAFPDTLDGLVALPGVGKNTAGAILAYAFNRPIVFVETNIRTVYIHHFFADRFDVDDKELASIITQTLDYEHPREFYWALMDYGAELKRSVRNITQSRHYTKQSTFAGSLREVRGKVLRALHSEPQSLAELQRAITDERLSAVLTDLLKEQLITERQGKYKLG